MIEYDRHFAPQGWIVAWYYRLAGRRRVGPFYWESSAREAMQSESKRLGIAPR